MADHHQGAVLGQLADRVEHHRHRAVRDLGRELAAAAPDGFALRPGRELLRVALADLRVGQPLPGTGIGLAQALVVLDVQAGHLGQLLGGTTGPREVGGDQQVRTQSGEQPGGPPRLQHALLGQLDVRGALEARFEVPGGLAVSPEDDARTSRLPAQL